jgi:hypothetical protein
MANCPSEGGITGVGETFCYFHPTVMTNMVGTTKIGVLMPEMRWLMDHGNANEATYTVRGWWLD